MGENFANVAPKINLTFLDAETGSATPSGASSDSHGARFLANLQVNSHHVYGASAAEKAWWILRCPTPQLRNREQNRTMCIQIA